ncbi:MAG: 23S rRNA pseudouridine(2605) synthase RluB [Pseudomonadota bacterium]
MTDKDSDLPSPPAGEKLQKVLARLGLGSRRELERAIVKGRIKVNGKVASLGDRVELTDRVEVDGKRIRLMTKNSKPLRVLLYNKPEGQICSHSDPEGRPTVFDNLPHLKGERWVAVGRLDFNTSGLLLFTTDGELANRLMHPASVIDREYLVRIQGDVDEDMKNRLREGILLDDGPAKFTDIVDAPGASRNPWFYCVLMQGRNREVRRLWESQGVKVSRLKRVRFGSIFIPSHVRSGQWIELNHKEVKDLCLSAGVEVPPQPSTATPAQQKAAQRHQRKLRAGKSRRV